MFVDASAAVAIILDEPECQALRHKLKSTKKRMMSALSSYESVMAIMRAKRVGVEDAYGLVREFQYIFAIKLIAIEPRFADIALEAFKRFGKGQGHPAKLNMGDCFSYACAKDYNLSLLFKGNDFSETDIKIA